MNWKSFLYKLTKSTGFIIEIENGNVKVVKGTVRPGFVKDCSIIFKEAGIKKGIIYSQVFSGQNTVISASGEIPPEVVQQLRNVWGFGK